MGWYIRNILLLSSCGVLAPAELVFIVGVHDEHGQLWIRERQFLHIHRPKELSKEVNIRIRTLLDHPISDSAPAVDHDGRAGLPHDGDELVHDSARHLGEVVLGLLARQRLLLQ